MIKLHTRLYIPGDLEDESRVIGFESNEDTMVVSWGAESAEEVDGVGHNTRLKFKI